MAINNDDFTKAFKTIAAKRPKLDLLFSYVEGNQPLRYSTERLEEAFSDIRARFEINWCNLIVNASLDRIELTGLSTEKDKAADDVLSTIFEKQHVSLEADRVHKGALVMEAGYVIIWKQPDGEIELYYNDPRICHIFYDDERPRVKRYAAKWFMRSDDHHEIILYYPERIEHYISKSKKENITNPNDFELASTEPNTFETIPVFELKTDGEISKVTSLQDAVNKTFADMMVAGEFGAFVQRWVISNSDPGALKNAPNEIWWIPSGDGLGQASSVGQFSPTDLKNYLDAMDTLATSMMIITRTPKHYLMTMGANISGETLIAMEGPLNKKIKKHIKRFSPAWQDIGAFILKLSGIEKVPDEIIPTWARAESVQPYTEAQTMQIAVNTGIPLITFLQRQGWTEAEIQQLMDDKKKEQAANRTLAQSVLANVRTQDAQNNAVPV